MSAIISKDMPYNNFLTQMNALYGEANVKEGIEGFAKIDRGFSVARQNLQSHPQAFLFLDHAKNFSTYLRDTYGQQQAAQPKPMAEREVAPVAKSAPQLEPLAVLPRRATDVAKSTSSASMCNLCTAVAGVACAVLAISVAAYVNS